jgi:sugar/nucleoside kinase (ribokinase family)
MLSQPRRAPPDLLVVGGMTVDRLPDGSATAGGSVVHGGGAAARMGARVAAVTLAGSEPEVTFALRGLRGGLERVEVQRVQRSIGFEHRVDGERRILRFLGSAGLPIRLDGAPAAGAILYAPVAGEIEAAGLTRARGGALRAAILQGWLRRLVPGELVSGLALAELDPDLVAALAQMDLVVASREDLLADAERPHEQLDALRSVLGPRPVLVLTDATAGAWFDHTGNGTSERWRVPVDHVVEGVPVVGAGDIFAAALALRWPRGGAATRDGITRAARAAAETVARELERRR